MGGKSARTKGSSFEREVAGKFTDMLGHSVKRVLLSGVRGEGDIECPSVHIECKRQERMRLSEWFNKEIDKAGDKPMALVHRQNRSKHTFVTMTIEDWVELFRETLA